MVQVALSLKPAVFAPGERPSTGRLYIIHRGIALYGGRMLTAGKVWGDDMLLTSPELRKPFVCTAMNYLEVFMIGCEAVMSIAEDFPESKTLIRKRQFFMSLRRTIVLLAKSELGLPPEALLAEMLNGGGGGGGGGGSGGGGGGSEGGGRAKGAGEGGVFMSSLASSRRSRKTATVVPGPTVVPAPNAPKMQPLPVERAAAESGVAALSGIAPAEPGATRGGETKLPPLTVQGARSPKVTLPPPNTSSRAGGAAASPAPEARGKKEEGDSAG